MLRFFLMILAVLPLMACATDSESVPTFAALQNPQELSAQNGVAPCPRFIGSVSAAEAIVNAAPRDYPHML